MRRHTLHNRSIAVLLTVPLTLVAAAAHGALISQWKFDDGSGQTASDSVGSNNGTLGATGSAAGDDPTWFGSGKIGTNSLNFDGTDDFVNIVHNATLNVSAFSVTGWVNIDTTKLSAFFDKTSNASNGSGIHERINIFGSDRRVRAFSGAVGTTADSTGSVALSTWTHIAATSDGTTLRVYINGIQDGSTTQGIVNNSVDLRIGSSLVLGNSYALDGRIDDVGFWGNQLSAAKVLAVYTVGDNTDPLGNGANLNYDLGQAQQLFNIYDAASGTVTIGGRTWQYITGLTTDQGELTRIGNSYFLRLDLAGNGVLSVGVPEPTSGGLLGLGCLGLATKARRRRRDAA